MSLNVHVLWINCTLTILSGWSNLMGDMDPLLYDRCLIVVMVPSWHHMSRPWAGHRFIRNTTHCHLKIHPPMVVITSSEVELTLESTVGTCSPSPRSCGKMRQRPSRAQRCIDHQGESAKRTRIGMDFEVNKDCAPIQENPDTRHAARTPTEEHRDERAHWLPTSSPQTPLTNMYWPLQINVWWLGVSLILPRLFWISSCYDPFLKILHLCRSVAFVNECGQQETLCV